MKIKDLKPILDKEKIDPVYYSINNTEPGYMEVVIYINDLHNGKYEVFYRERDEIKNRKIYDNEEEACLYFLVYFIESNHLNLCKYFKRGKKYNVSLWRQEQIDKYGSEEEGMA